MSTRPASPSRTTAQVLSLACAIAMPGVSDALAAQDRAPHSQVFIAPPHPVGARRFLSAPPSSAAQAAPGAFSVGLRHGDVLKLGGMAAGALLIATADRRGDAWARRPGVQDDATLRRLSRAGDLTGTWVATGIGPTLWLLGRARGDSGTAVMGLRTTEAVAASGAVISAIKLLAGRTRPYASPDHSPAHWDFLGGLNSDSTRSFASGHSALAAAAAATLAVEWRRQGRSGWKTVGPPLVYALAAMTAGSRVRDRKHWLSDVVSGSAIGMLGAISVRRWHDAHPGNRLDRALLSR
ncbi:MAG: phosphatase PAP2 family protein [Gemmatimonadaceae bacterium]|nr:phosphatase PAP2 family protein [Gemmatimonadaceae bacterium]